jgi:hypothetical protein
MIKKWSAAPMKASRLFLQWILVTTIAGVITAFIQMPVESLLQWLIKWLTSRATIVIIGLMQTMVLWNHTQQRNRWIKLMGLQFIAIMTTQAIILFISLIYAFLAIAHLGKGGIWSSFADFSSFVLLIVGLISHTWVQGEGLRSVWRDRDQSRYPSCPLYPAIE